MVIALVLLAAPAAWEGPVLLPISPGHALSLLDTLALAPLLLGTGVLYAGLWRRRRRLAGFIGRAPGRSIAGSFAAGAGLGLLIASVFSWFWWWAIGAALVSLGLLGAVLVAASGRYPGTGADPERER